MLFEGWIREREWHVEDKQKENIPLQLHSETLPFHHLTSGYEQLDKLKSYCPQLLSNTVNSSICYLEGFPDLKKKILLTYACWEAVGNSHRVPFERTKCFRWKIIQVSTCLALTKVFYLCVSITSIPAKKKKSSDHYHGNRMYSTATTWGDGRRGKLLTSLHILANIY